MKKAFDKQGWHFLAILASLILMICIAQTESIFSGDFWGLSTKTWLLIVIAIPVVHQIYVVIVWRLELYKQSISKKLGKTPVEVNDFPGFVSREKKVEYLCRSHVMVYPSLREGWGLTNIEANSCGTTVVAADSPGLCDSVRDGVSGRLYQFGNIDQMTERITEILTDDDQRQKLEQGGLEWAAKFNWDKAADKFLALCLEVAGKT